MTEPCVRWDSDAMPVDVLGDGDSRIVEVRKQGYDLIAYMAARNADGSGGPVVSTTDELLEAVWGERHAWDKYRPPYARQRG